ncbi:predicted protein [Botrytis cinerea T4]|uniref:Uncharacterized protein n=1 Tax=Botryotinia fuckeliana (strain T4) TaxID=999810 RepID=G2YNS7_BOTF4|nr:predicted protein [Botrytis cinerea T4]
MLCGLKRSVPTSITLARMSASSKRADLCSQSCISKYDSPYRSQVIGRLRSGKFCVRLPLSQQQGL